MRAVGFLVLVLTAAIIACSNLGQTTGIDVGPNFPSKTLYATNSNQNAISIYTNGTKNGGGPTFNIGGSSTTLDGPQYLAFDRAQNLWVTNYNPSTNAAAADRVRGARDGQRDPAHVGAHTGRPRGIAFTPKLPTPLPSSSPSAGAEPHGDRRQRSRPMTYPNQVLLFTAGSTSPYPIDRGTASRV